jgi:hypothetical protein
MGDILQVFFEAKGHIIDHIARKNKIVAPDLEYLVDRNIESTAKYLYLVEAQGFFATYAAIGAVCANV